MKQVELGFLSFASKLVEERQQMVHMASFWRLYGDEVKDGRVDAMGYIRLFYPNFVVFIVLGNKGSLVINFSINKTPRIGGEATIQSSMSHPLAIVSFWEVWVCFMV
jgi:hypothetical protein